MIRGISAVFRHYPLKRKLMFFFLLLSSMCILVTSVAFLLNQFYRYNQNAREEIKAQASILARNTAAAVTFKDTAAANEILSGLKANPRIVAVALFTADNNLFAHYVAQDTDKTRLRNEFTALFQTRPSINPKTLYSSLLKASGDFPMLEVHPLVSEPIVLDNERVGTVVVQTDLHYLYQEMIFLAVLMSCVALITFLVAWLLARRFQHIISDPIVALSALMKQVSNDKNYALRAISDSPDEIGTLITGFNEMLHEIQNRDRIVSDQQQLLLNEKNSRIRMLTAAVEQSDNSIVISSPLGDIEYANPHFYAATGLTVDEVIGQKPWVLNSGTEFFEKYREIWQAVSKGGKWAGEFQNRRKNGEFFWEQATISPVFDDLGGITCLIAIMVDITERKQAEEEMRQAKEQAEAANRAKSEFLANMSHEIRTPMNGVIGMAQLLEMTELTEEQQEYTGLLIGSGSNLLSLINDILDLSKIEVGRVKLEANDFNLQEMIQGTANLLSLRSKEKGLELVSLIDPDVPLKLKGDAGRIRQVLTNLLGNAIKFTPKGIITLRTQKICEDETSATLRFVIRDTGIGIPADKLGMIFDPFTQADGSTTRSYGGTGLGLTISQQLANLMGGSIDVESVEGEGSSFWFDVVLEKQAQEVDTLQGCRDPGGRLPLLPLLSTGNNIRLLLVEDEPTNQLVIKSSLTKFGYHVVVANNGCEAINELENNDYALVLMDCMMPLMNGYEATAVIRDQSSAVRNHSIPVIALTAKAFNEDRVLCQAAGMNDFLSKPVYVKDLLAKVKKWVTIDSAQVASF